MSEGRLLLRSHYDLYRKDMQSLTERMCKSFPISIGSQCLAIFGGDQHARTEAKAFVIFPSADPTLLTRVADILSKNGVSISSPGSIHGFNAMSENSLIIETNQ